MDNRIKEKLAQLGMTQRELAVRVEVQEALLNKYILGQHQPRYETMCKIASALGSTVSHVFPPPPTEAAEKK